MSIVANDLLEMNSMTGEQSIRLLLNVANSYFLYQRAHNSDLDPRVVLAFLFLRESWNDFYEVLRKRLAKFGDMTFGDALQITQMDVLANEDPRLSEFMKEKILTHTVITGVIFDNGLL